MANQNSPGFDGYYQQIDPMVINLLDRESAEYLLAVDFEQYLKHLVGELSWEPLQWDEGAKTVEPFVAKVEGRDRWDNRPFVQDVQKLRLRIPCSSHPQRRQYLELRPSSYRMSGEPDWRFDGNVLVLEMEASTAAVEQALDAVRFWFGTRNADIEKGNAKLEEKIRPVWRARRDRLEAGNADTAKVLETLNIPLHLDPNARVKPVEFKPRAIRLAAKPTGATKAEPSLLREDVLKLVEFIDEYARQFEVAPSTYARFDEEELRNLIVGMLNANYPGAASGETFNKLGKTDISLRVATGEPLVAECKFWGGAKSYGDAIDQLFRYLTWRQSFGVLLHFCKLKDMSTAVDAARQATLAHTSYTADTFARRTTSSFMTRHSHPQDSQRSVEIFHLFFDLSV